MGLISPAVAATLRIKFHFQIKKEREEGKKSSHPIHMVRLPRKSFISVPMRESTAC